MSEWLGKPRITKEDIIKSQPSMEEFFPSLVKYYVENQKYRVVVPFERENYELFKKAVIEEYGKFTPNETKEAIEEAILLWVAEKLRKEEIKEHILKKKKVAAEAKD